MFLNLPYGFTLALLVDLVILENKVPFPGPFSVRPLYPLFSISPFLPPLTYLLSALSSACDNLPDDGIRPVCA